MEKLEGFKARSYLDTAELRTVGFGFNMDSLFSKKTWDELEIPEDFSRVYDESQLISRDSAYALFYDIWKDAENSAIQRASVLGLNFKTFPDWKKFILKDIVYNTGSANSWTKVFTEVDSDKVLFEARRKQTIVDGRVAKIGYHYGLLKDLDDAHRIGLIGAKYIV